MLDGWLAYAYENQQRWRMLFRDQGGDDDIRCARAEVHERAREVLASFLAAHPPSRSLSIRSRPAPSS